MGTGLSQEERLPRRAHKDCLEASFEGPWVNNKEWILSWKFFECSPEVGEWLNIGSN